MELREKKYKETILTKDIEMHVLEIPKIKENEILKDELALWLKFIENPKNEEVEKLMCENIFLKQAREELAYLSGEPDFQDIVQSRADFLRDQYSYNAQARRNGLAEGRKEGIKEGIKTGEKMGEKKKQKEIAIKLIKLEMPIEQIVEVTGLTKEEVMKLKESKN